MFRCEALQTAYSPQLDLQLASGEALGIRGPSGSGKSTALRALADLLPHSGQCWLDQKPATDYTAIEWRRKVLYLPPRTHIRREPFPELMSSHAASQLRQRLGLAAVPSDKPSSGEEQRWMLLRALLREPRVLLLDEMGAHLDQKLRQVVQQILAEWLQSTERALIWVSHDKDLLAACDCVIELDAQAGGGAL